MNKKLLEKRYITDNNITVDTEDDGKMILQGRAITYDVPSADLGGFKEIIKRYSVTYAKVVKATVDHNDSQLIAKTGVNLTFNDKSDGLWYRIELPDTNLGRDLYEMAKAGLAVANSFEFYADEEHFISGGIDELDIREVTKLTLVKINPLMNSDPAYKESLIAKIRSYKEFKDSQKVKLTENRTETTEPDKGTEIKSSEPKQTSKDNNTMNKKELLDSRALKMAAIDTAENLKDTKALNAEVRAIDEKLEAIEESQELAKRSFDQAKTGTKKENKNMDKLNFRSLPNTGLNLNMSAPEVRATVSNDVLGGQGRVSKSLIEALAPENILKSVGATITYNNFPTRIPIANNLTGTSTFVGENVKAPLMDFSLQSKTLVPKRVPIQIEVSNTALRQDEVGIEAAILKSAVQGLYKTIETVLFSNDVSTADAPAGLLALATTFDELTKGVSYDLVVKRKNALKALGVGNISMIGTSEIATDLELTIVDGGSGLFLMENDRIRGGVDFTQSAYIHGAENAQDVALMGDFSQVHINFFDSIRITKDDVTKAGEDLTIFTFQFNVDWAIAHPAALLFLSNIKE